MNIYRSFISAATPFIAIRRRAFPLSDRERRRTAIVPRISARVPHSSVPEVPRCTLHRNCSRNSRPTMDRVEFTCGWDRGLFLVRSPWISPSSHLWIVGWSSLRVVSWDFLEIFFWFSWSFFLSFKFRVEIFFNFQNFLIFSKNLCFKLWMVS